MPGVNSSSCQPSLRVYECAPSVPTAAAAWGLCSCCRPLRTNCTQRLATSSVALFNSQLIPIRWIKKIGLRQVDFYRKKIASWNVIPSSMDEFWALTNQRQFQFQLGFQSGCNKNPFSSPSYYMCQGQRHMCYQPTTLGSFHKFLRLWLVFAQHQQIFICALVCL